ncbi:MAG: two-component system, OmpR family, alkaline phosphatase synthesis response regulator PhoP [Anaerophaga sp.]|uniref:response regulator transcription factor n=1 Tax=Anaerophaga thermohalophila TaxID=177400 RepID=UPI000237C678|nr:response regulator transcription factor [Anaerophaga thermohalophila]MDK2842019.1 two-component system, OmpR family, alkaline phosphatase synthesis response regulator PhoP [Anaerophaga sp.]
MSESTDYKILLVDDEPDILEFIGYNLKKEGFQVETATNGKDALKTAQSLNPHLIVLDVMMPGMDGIETCEEIRKIPSLKDTLVVFLTARGEDYSQIAGFDAGADDYITKPIKPRVLISRVKALLKRFRSGIYSDTAGDDTRISVGDLTIDKEKYVVISGNNELVLPKKEFELLLLLASKPDRVFTRDEIYSSVWGDNIIVGDRTIDVHIRKLREKIGQNHIRTIKGVGYKFVN